MAMMIPCPRCGCKTERVYATNSRSTLPRQHIRACVSPTCSFAGKITDPQLLIRWQAGYNGNLVMDDQQDQ